MLLPQCPQQLNLENFKTQGKQSRVILKCLGIDPKSTYVFEKLMTNVFQEGVCSFFPTLSLDIRILQEANF